MIYFYTQVIVRDRDQWLREATSYLHVATRARTWARFQRGNSEGLARELRGFSAGLAWGLIFFALRVASRQNTFDSNIAMPVLYHCAPFLTLGWGLGGNQGDKKYFSNMVMWHIKLTVMMSRTEYKYDFLTMAKLVSLGWGQKGKYY